MAEIQLSTIKKLSLIHKVMFFTQIAFAGICFYLSYSGTVPPTLDKETEKILQVVALVFSAAGFFGGTFLMKKKILEARAMNGTVQQKFDLFKSFAILQWAMLEGPTLLCIIVFLLSGNYAVLVLAGVLITCFGMLAPTRSKVAFQLSLSDAEAAEL
jgi:hypothetical protein